MDWETYVYNFENSNPKEKVIGMPNVNQKDYVDTIHFITLNSVSLKNSGPERWSRKRLSLKHIKFDHYKQREQ